MIDTQRIVWVSRAPMDSTRVKGFLSDVFIADEASALEAIEASRQGVALPRVRFPQVIFVERPGVKMKKLPDLALAGGFWTVSAAIADVLRSVDLGRSSLYPAKAFRHDRKTPLEGEYFCLNFGETKSAFLPEQSPRAKGNPYDKVQTSWTMQLAPKDGDMAVDECALAGPELWVDPLVRNAFFLSDRLAQALKAAKLARHWGLFHCRVLRA